MNFAPGILWATLHNDSRQIPKIYGFSTVSQCGFTERFYQGAEAPKPLSITFSFKAATTDIKKKKKLDQNGKFGS